MIATRLRLLLALARPAVLFLLALYVAIGAVLAGADSLVAIARSLLIVSCYVIFSVVCNDIADAAIDRVNLAGDTSRPLVAGLGQRREMVTIAAFSATAAVAASLAANPLTVAVTIAGLAISAGYSVRPTRFADRGAVASLILPACYVAVPFLVGYLGSGRLPTSRHLIVLVALYIGFIGRILLKDFRDIRGDEMFGKRTFLVRHGRRATCWLSACCWVVGATALAFALGTPTWTLPASFVVGVGLVLALLRGLAVNGGHRRDEAIISSVAIVGRALQVIVLAEVTMAASGWSSGEHAATIVVLAGVMYAQAWRMIHRGPPARVASPVIEVQNLRTPADMDGLPARYPPPLPARRGTSTPPGR